MAVRGAIGLGEGGLGEKDVDVGGERDQVVVPAGIAGERETAGGASMGTPQAGSVCTMGTNSTLQSVSA